MGEKEKLQAAAAGALTGASIAAILGQIPPFTLLPEEIGTVPILAIIGAWWGYSHEK
jgi:hypothetical protein